MGKRVEKTRCSGTMTEAGFKSHIISILRKASQRWKPIGQVRSAARVGRGLYLCNSCHKIVKPSDVVIDHISPVVPLSGFDSFDSFINRLFCETDNLQLLCKCCHNKKTSHEANVRKSK